MEFSGEPAGGDSVGCRCAASVATSAGCGARELLVARDDQARIDGRLFSEVELGEFGCWPPFAAAAAAAAAAASMRCVLLIATCTRNDVPRERPRPDGGRALPAPSAISGLPTGLPALEVTEPGPTELRGLDTADGGSALKEAGVS